MAANSSSCIGTDPLADPNSHSNSTTPPTVTVSAPPTRRQAQLDCRHICCAAGVAQCTGPPSIEGVRTGHRHRRRRQYTSNRRCTHREPSPAPSAVHPRSQACAQSAVTGAVSSPPEIAGVGTRRRHQRRQKSLPRHTVSESARSVADCRPTFDTCRSSEGWMWLPSKNSRATHKLPTSDTHVAVAEGL